MKKFLHFFLLSAMLFSVAGFVACGDDSTEGDNETPKPVTETTFEIVSVEADFLEATVTLKSSGCTEYAYEVKLKSDAVSAPAVTVLFATAESEGRTAALQDGTTTLVLDTPALSPSTQYVVYVAAKTTKGGFYKQVLSAEFETKSLDNTTEGLNFIGSMYDGYALYVDMPQSVKDAGNALRWHTVDVFTYYTHTVAMARSDAFALLTNGNNKFLYDDTMLVLDDYNAYERDEEGNIIYYENDLGELEAGQIYDEIVPGQLSYFIVGEFSWAEAGEVLGWGAGYHIPLFDDYAWQMADYPTDAASQKNFWSGYYDRQIFEAKKPQPMEQTVQLVVDNEMANNARITLTPDEGVQVYCYWVVPNSVYLQVADILDADKDGNVEEDFQWFITSFAALWEGAKQSPDENNDGKPDAVQFQLADGFYEDAAPTPGVPYHIFCTAIADNGAKQSFLHETIVLPDYTLDAPEVVVTPVPEKTTETTVCFNVKVTNGVGYIAKYFCDSEANWSDATGQGYTVDNLLYSYGAYFSPEDVALMNSSEGYDVVIGEGAPFAFDELARIAVQVENLEGRKSEVVLAEVRTKPEPKKDPVDPAYISRLVGDWTISAQVLVSEGESGGWVAQAEPVVSTVTIMDQIAYSEELFEAFVKGMMSVQQEQQRGYWEEYKAEADRINLNLKNQNRLLCLGFDLFHADNTFKPALAPATPWDLFTSPTYGASETVDCFRDFGPKWYIDVNPDGTMYMPLNINVFGTLTSWFDDYDYFMMGWNPENNYYLYMDMATAGYAKFPVTISEDGNTLTIEPIVYNGNTYYPTPVINYYGNIQSESIVGSAITLTRNNGGAAALLSTPTSSQGKLVSVQGVGEPLPDLDAQHVYSRSRLPKELKPLQKPYTTQVKLNIPTSMEQIIENARRRSL